MTEAPAPATPQARCPAQRNRRGSTRYLPPLVLSALFLFSCTPPPKPASPALLTPAPIYIEDWSFQGHPGSLIRTRGYRLFTTATDPDLVAQLPEFLEHCLDRYTSAFGPLPRPPMKLDTFLMADRAQWSELTRQAMGRHADLYLLIERGGFASGGRAMLWPIGRRDTLAIAAHEGWHQYTQRTFKDDLPVWLEEGIGTWMEGLAPDPAAPHRLVLSGWSNPERLDQLRRAASRHQLMPLDQLLEATPQSLIHQSTDTALTYYAQVWTLTHFLREAESSRHAPALHLLLSDAATGRLKPAAPASSTDVFIAYFGDVRAASASYAEYLDSLCTGGAGVPPATAQP